MITRSCAKPPEIGCFRFPPPALLKTSDCLWLAHSPIASDHIVTIALWRRRGFVEFGNVLPEPWSALGTVAQASAKPNGRRQVVGVPCPLRLAQSVPGSTF